VCQESLAQGSGRVEIIERADAGRSERISFANVRFERVADLSLFDHLICYLLQTQRHDDSALAVFRLIVIFVFERHLNRQLGWLRSAENSVHVRGCPAKQVDMLTVHGASRQISITYIRLGPDDRPHRLDYSITASA